MNLRKFLEFFGKFHWNFDSDGHFGCKMVVIAKISDKLAVATNTHRHTHVVEKRIQFFANESYTDTDAHRQHQYHGTLEHLLYEKRARI